MAMYSMPLKLDSTFQSNISNTRPSVSSRYPKMEKTVEKYDARRSIFDEILLNRNKTKE